MSRFNLIDEKWIPVRFPDGAREELGIRDTLLRSKEIAAIEDPSPLVVAALHRFLLAVLYRALEGPTDIDQAKILFLSGLPGQRITAYLEKWRERFWLFDEKYPFGQNPNVSRDEIEPWTKLTAEYNATSNKVLFDHTNTKNPGAREPKECARWLLSTMTFSISGGRGYYPSPSPNAMMCIPLGRNFHETLCYCLVPYPNRNVMSGDSTLWEREPKALPLNTPKQMATGYADLYTWQSRMIRLEEQPTGEVSMMRFVAGQGFENPSSTPDPMHPYKLEKNKGILPVQFRKDRGVWRDFDSLLPDSSELAPITIQNAVKLAGKNMNYLPESVLILGLKYEPPNANLEFWRMECLSLPKALAGDRFIRTDIRQFLADAEEAQKTLWTACNSFARDLISRGDKRPVSKKDISDFVEQMPVSSVYWSTLESCFHKILSDYNLERDPEDIRCQWLKFVRDAMRTAWKQHTSSVSTGDAWAIRALVKAERPVLRKLKELNDEISKLEPSKEKL
ncbi:type I-E CRISPR-associated protein Cse1/CasA [Pelobacter propionicus]|uniref:CRISPR-associated protein, Cse1 family n=1 Tax=Pelobacter propionicus (strain DSM 2379 / NBRC 103807 / OttBd1) TaxID=338966 RepID=A1ARH9_PELPD|nr:type I-E CRISPR-associated protein Cse1/CasA [Pelobacter propionicus]ABK99949.1 CRISPR-associated protein, Cse1 family [Pelobacter propionicus DSM 2379]